MYRGASRNESKNSRPIEGFGLAIRRHLQWQVLGFRLVTVRHLMFQSFGRSVHLTASQRAFYIDITSGKVSVGGDGNTRITFTSKPDVARYVSYVLTHLPPKQLENRSFAIAGDNKVTSSLSSWSCSNDDEPVNSRSMKYSRYMKKGLGRSCRSPTFLFPNLTQD